MNVRLVPLLAALLPFFAVHATYLVAATYGQVDWCLPYFDSCTSISATGRKPPASYLFRAAMLPTAVIVMAYWWLSYAWLSAIADRHARDSGSGGRWMLALGLIAGLGLILYATVLGEAGDIWRLQRRIGAVLFFSLTYLAQLLLTGQLWQLRRQLPTVPAALLWALWGLSALVLATGLLSVALDSWSASSYDRVENAFEWLLSLMLQSHFLIAYFIWRAADWRLQVK